MPDNKEHCQQSFERYGVRGDDIHTWMDEPSYIYGSSHRKERHDPDRDLPIVIRMFGKKYGNDTAKQIFLDHIALDNKEHNNKEHERNQLSQNEHSSTYSSSTHLSSDIDWAYYFLLSVPIGGMIILFTYIFNKAFGNPIGLWWAENWYKVVGFSIFAIILGILFLYYWKKRG